MPFIDDALAREAQEKTAAPIGDYDLIISDAQIMDSKSVEGAQNIRCQIDFIGYEEQYDPIWHYFSLPFPGDDEKKARDKAIMRKRFIHHTGIPHNNWQYDSDDFPGTQFHMAVDIEELDDGREVNRLVVPRLPDEVE